MMSIVTICASCFKSLSRDGFPWDGPPPEPEESVYVLTNTKYLTSHRVPGAPTFCYKCGINLDPEYSLDNARREIGRFTPAGGSIK